MGDRVEILEQPTWFLQPGDRIVETLVDELKAEPVMRLIFGDNIEPYRRMDFGARQFPALRVYNETGEKTAETWYLNGDIKIDICLPPSLRRAQNQQFPDLLTSALLALFRAQPFFDRVRAQIPGLNQLGWNFRYDKGLAFVPAEGDPVPLTQITINFRVLLNEWDAYLETDDRTPQQPFERTLEDLRIITIGILGKDDQAVTQVTVPLQVKT